MKRFKAFGARRSVDEKGITAAVKVSTPLQCLPGLYSPARESSRRRSVDSSRFKEIVETTPEAASSSGYVARRRSVDDSLFNESEDLHAVRQEIWKVSPLRWAQPAPATSSSDSFSSSSSLPSDASVASETFHRYVGEGGIRATVLGFDANAREAGVSATILWAFRNVLHKGDVLVMLGVLDYIRGPLGYKVQVTDQTWLGANKRALHDEIRARNVAWLNLPRLRSLCDDAGVKLIVDVKAAARAEVAIVHEAVALSATHVVLDQSLHNRRRRYYLERLACDVTRMRRSGGVESIRSLATIASDSEKGRSVASPTSVLTPQRPPRGRAVAPSSASGTTALLQQRENSASNSNLSRLVRLVEKKSDGGATSSSSSPHFAVDEGDELFSIDHAFMARRVTMLLAPQPDLMDRRHDQLAMDEDGYESDDLFSLAGDGASRRPSIAVFCSPEAPSLSARDSVSGAARPLQEFSWSSCLDSGPCLDKRLVPSGSLVAVTMTNNVFANSVFMDFEHHLIDRRMGI